MYAILFYNIKIFISSESFFYTKKKVLFLESREDFHYRDLGAVW